MSKHKGHFLLQFLLVLLNLHVCSYGLQHIVGDSVWTIPPSDYFYSNWSSSRSFHIGDTLLFDFDPQLYNVMRVSRREYEGCTAENPFQVIEYGPATVHLMEGGVYYYICSVLDHCTLGQKLSVTVHQTWSPDSAPSPSPSQPHHPLAAPPYTSHPPTNVADWSVLLVGFANACEAIHGVVLSWFFSVWLSLWFFFG